MAGENDWGNGLLWGLGIFGVSAITFFWMDKPNEPAVPPKEGFKWMLCDDFVFGTLEDTTEPKVSYVGSNVYPILELSDRHFNELLGQYVGGEHRVFVFQKHFWCVTPET